MLQVPRSLFFEGIHVPPRTSSPKTIRQCPDKPGHGRCRHAKRQPVHRWQSPTAPTILRPLTRTLEAFVPRRISDLRIINRPLRVNTFCIVFGHTFRGESFLHRFVTIIAKILTIVHCRQRPNARREHADPSGVFFVYDLIPVAGVQAAICRRLLPPCRLTRRGRARPT